MKRNELPTLLFYAFQFLFILIGIVAALVKVDYGIDLDSVITVLGWGIVGWGIGTCVGLVCAGFVSRN